ncbi:protein PLASTID MOVEMENT IMPAIRED 2-like [Vicia villosa]|uniref:protein PLASTID MOVEMENT IMPAIRED 2-like n=1 Tax=Vicia villosa TaxID=3911 RepID=UPI00273C330A|nr:protein PLASTID MOVEMENT IMPAIRED 2-like [Vicia villosa]
MDDAKVGMRRVRSVKDVINLYDDRNHRNAETDNSSLKKTQMDSSLNPTSRTKELHKARMDIGKYKETRWTAETTKSQAESELSNAKKTMKNLSSMIEESSYKAKARMRDIETLKKGKSQEHGAMVVSRNESYEYAKVMKELEYIKKELFKLKLDVASVLEEKLRAEKEIKASSSKMIACSSKAEELRKEIEEANEEQVLAELARIEALKEFEDVKARKESKEKEFLSKLETTRKKIKEAEEERDESKELEMKLAMTVSDVELLQNQLVLVTEMEKRVQGDESVKLLEGGLRKSGESGELEEDSTELHAIKEELEASTRELELIRAEGFQFMASMDVIRNELKHITKETARLKKNDSSAQNLTSKLLRMKSKLEAASAAEEKAKSLVISLSYSLENLKTETDEAKNEKAIISQEIITTKDEIQKTDYEIDANEEKLQGVMNELEEAKATEALALEKLKTLSETAMRERAITAKHSSLITISKFEYEYLTNHAAAAEEIADKKVAAAEAWIEALKASEKEIVMETKIAQREFKETMLKEEREFYIKEKKMVARRVGSEEFDSTRIRDKSSGKNLQRAFSRKSFKSNGSLTPAKRAKFQMSSGSPAPRHLSPFALKKRKKVIPNLTKLFSGKKNSRSIE